MDSSELNDYGIISQLIDIREPLSNLRDTLEQRLGGIDLSEYNFWLQDSQMLPLNTSLVDQCVQGEGLVQINVEIKSDEGDGSKRINVVDVLKPSDEAFSETDVNVTDDDDEVTGSSSTAVIGGESSGSSKENSSSSPSSSSGKNKSNNETVARWVVCSTFRKEQERLRIPMDPVQWNVAHVAHWAKWAKQEFNKASINLIDWGMNGKDLCALSHDEFKRKVVSDPADLLWTHLELLRKCKFVAVVQKSNSDKSSGGSGTRYSIGSASATSSSRKTHKKAPVKLGTPRFTVMSESSTSPGNRTGNNGQVQLWQFLLELLTEKEHREVIHWIGDEGEFKLNNPEMVAQLWGIRKNKPNMNYEKLSRALRYYYDGDMISKVQNKRFVYKFVCDLKNLIGYTAAEINTLVLEAEQKSLGRINIYNS